MRNISGKELSAEAFGEILLELGRRRPFRDPLAAEETTLTPAQFHTFLWLGHDGPLTMGELARRLCVTEKTITGMVDRLEREDYVRRERNETDRRVVRVRLMRKGEQTFQRMRDLYRRRLGTFLQALDLEDRKDLFRILNKLLARGTAEGAPEARVKPEE